jgi:YYY domain-containing protein
LQSEAALLLDWFTREGGIVLSWWALVTLAGAAALPLCARLLGGLPDRGYTLARTVGVLLVGFVYWLLASWGFFRNTPGNMIFAWAIVLVSGLLIYVRGRFSWRSWWRENRAVVLVAEVLFFVLLFGWAIVRAHQNGLVATEKPMELAFISATMRSETFPPNDPWMSGYAISYYYFGYVIAAMLSTLSNIPSVVGFNMNISFLFALTGLSAFGVVYNLVRSGSSRSLTPAPVSESVRGDAAAYSIADATHATSAQAPPPSTVYTFEEPVEMDATPGSRTAAILTGLLAMVFIVLLGNYQLPLIELPYQTRVASADYLAFFDSNDRNTPRPGLTAEADDTSPERWDFWWWFRAARVLNDRNLDGNREEVIDEFPQFSFLLADNHPHVLALPFAVLAIGLMLNVLLLGRSPKGLDIVFYAVCLGGLMFLNTWDGPIYMAGLVGAEALRRIAANGSWRLRSNDWTRLIILGVTLFGLSILLYLPFWVSFRSQLAGVLPNLIHPTLFQQFFVHFAPFILLLIPFLAVEAWRAGWHMNWRLGVGVGLGILLLLIVFMLMLAVIGWLSPALRGSVLSFVEANGGWNAVLPTLLQKRVTHGLTAIVLTFGVIIVVARLFPRVGIWKDDENPGDAGGSLYPPATGFALLLVGIGLMLTLVPEFIYLRDNFSTRMNTIFKFYYQAWVVFGLASAYGVYTLLADRQLRALPMGARAAFAVLLTVVLTGGLLYPILGIHNRIFIETGRASGSTAALTLNGGFTAINSDDYQALMCLGQLVDGDDAVVVEAVGGSYDSRNPPSGLAGRFLGIPNVLNWEGHQAQWRGVTYGAIVGTRGQDIDRLFADPTWNTAEQVIQQYGIDYIFFGTHERQKYGTAAETKFRDRLPIVCESGESRVYRVEDRVTALQ